MAELAIRVHELRDRAAGARAVAQRQVEAGEDEGPAFVHRGGVAEVLAIEGVDVLGIRAGDLVEGQHAWPRDALQRTPSDDAKDLHLRGLALHAHGGQRLERDAAVEAPRGGGAHEDVGADLLGEALDAEARLTVSPTS